MSKLYKASEWVDLHGMVHVQCDDLVGTGRNWIEPARIMNIKPSEFVIKLREEFKAEITPYRKDNKVLFIGYAWKSLTDARRFKNYINKLSREKDYKI